MKRYLKFELLLPLLAAFMTVAVTVFRTLSVCLAYEADVGYFIKGHPAVLLANLLTVVYILAAFGLSAVSCFGKLMPAGDPLKARVAALALGCAVCMFCIDHLSLDFSAGRGTVLLLLSVIFAFLGLAFCALTFLKVNTLEPVRAFGALCLSMSFILHTLLHYVSTDTPINGDLKILYMFAAISAALFFLSEGKRIFAKHNGITARFFSLCCCMLCISTGAAECFTFFFKKEAFADSYTHPFLLLFVGVYAFVRLFAARVPVATATPAAELEDWGDEEVEGQAEEISPKE